MRRAILFLAAVMSASTVAAEDVSTPNYTLPLSADEPVITIDYRGDRLRRIDDAPTMSILPDGRVVMPRSYRHTKAYEGRISQAELQELLGFIIGENKFYEHDDEAIRSKQAGLPGQTLPLHSSTTVIRVHANSTVKEVSHRGLGRGPMVDETSNLLAIKKRLDRVMSVVKLGGEEAVAKWLAEANQELRARSPGADPLTAEHLHSGTERADGSTYVRFSRPGAGAQTSTSVTISVAANGKRSISVVRDNR